MFWNLAGLGCASVSFCPPSRGGSKVASRALARPDLSAELQVGGGLEEAGVAVFLHQRVDLGLSQVEAGLRGLLHVLLGDGLGDVVQVDLQDKRSRVRSTCRPWIWTPELRSSDLPLSARRRGRTRRRSCWLWPPAWTVWSPCSPRRPGRRRCSPR